MTFDTASAVLFLAASLVAYTLGVVRTRRQLIPARVEQGEQ